jgi:hypothetical protein
MQAYALNGSKHFQHLIISEINQEYNWFVTAVFLKQLNSVSFPMIVCEQ